MYSFLQLFFNTEKISLNGRLNSTVTGYVPANNRLHEDVFRLRLQKTSSRRLDQDEYVRLILTSSEDVFKTSSRRLGQDQYICLAIRLQDVFKTFSRRLQDFLNTSCQDVFKTFSRRLQDVLQRYLHNVFKTYHQVKLFLLTRL